MPSTQPFPDESVLDIRQLKQLHRAGLLAILLIAVIVAVGVAALEYSARWVQHTREVLRTVRELQTSLLQIESRALQSAMSRSSVSRSGQSAPVAGTSAPNVQAESTRSGGEPNGSQPSVSAPSTRAQVDEHITRLLTLTEDNATQQERARRLAEAVNQWAAERTALLGGRSTIAIDAPTAALQQLLQEFQAEESNLYGRRVARQQRWRATLVIVVMAALALVAFALHRMTRNVLREVGQRRRVEGERDRAQVLLDFALDRSPLAVAVLEPDNSLRVANKAWRALDPRVRPPDASTTRPEIEPERQVGELRLHPDLEAVVEEVRRTSEPAVAEIALPFDTEAETVDAALSPKTGQVMLVSAHRIESASRGEGQTDAAVGLVVLDLSEQRWLETQLRHAQRMEALGRLAGGVAHDINNVVTAIIGFTDMAIAGVRARDAAEQVDADLRQVRRAADRAAVMARQLLSFSRQRITHERPIDVSDVVHDIEPMLRRILGSHVRFHVHTDSRGWAVLADPGQIEQVLLNLAINARDAMERGGELTVSVQMVDAASMQAAAAQRAWLRDDASGRAARSSDALQKMHDGVCLMVRDTGSGIPLAVQSRMFEPFFTTKAEGKGTGLGLATVRQIVDDLEGFVTIHSVPGEGSSISVFLPRISGDPEPPRLLASRGSRPPLVGAVLVAEDDRDVRYLVEQVLSDAGYTVHTVRNGGEALTAIERATSPYQLLITDLVMPDVGGVRLGSHHLVAKHVGAVLYMSGYPADSYGEQTALPEQVHFLAKPFSPAELLAAVDEAVRAGKPDSV